jgi:hypothetical protein
MHIAVPGFQGLGREMDELSQRHALSPPCSNNKVHFSFEEQPASDGSQLKAERRHRHQHYGSDASYTDEGSDNYSSDGFDTDESSGNGMSKPAFAPVPGASRFLGMAAIQDAGVSESEELGKTAL